jgi:hypothetical protein
MQGASRMASQVLDCLPYTAALRRIDTVFVMQDQAVPGTVQQQIACNNLAMYGKQHMASRARCSKWQGQQQLQQAGSQWCHAATFSPARSALQLPAQR